jgi:hypothetical protein
LEGIIEGFTWLLILGFVTIYLIRMSLYMKIYHIGMTELLSTMSSHQIKFLQFTIFPPSLKQTKFDKEQATSISRWNTLNKVYYGGGSICFIGIVIGSMLHN